MGRVQESVLRHADLVLEPIHELERFASSHDAAADVDEGKNAYQKDESKENTPSLRV